MAAGWLGLADFAQRSDLNFLFRESFSLTLKSCYYSAVLNVARIIVTASLEE